MSATASTSDATGTESTFETRAARLHAALTAISRLDPEVQAAMDELVAAANDHQAAVLRAIVRHLRDDERGRELLYEVVTSDPEVHTAMVKAGIVKPSLAMRAIQVLDGVRPYLTSHNGDVELVRIDDGVAYVRLLGACQSCSSSTDTLRDSVAEALLAALPELREVRDVPPDSAPVTAFVPLSSLSFRRSGAR